MTIRKFKVDMFLDLMDVASAEELKAMQTMINDKCNVTKKPSIFVRVFSLLNLDC